MRRRIAVLPREGSAAAAKRGHDGPLAPRPLLLGDVVLALRDRGGEAAARRQALGRPSEPSRRSRHAAPAGLRPRDRRRGRDHGGPGNRESCRRSASPIPIAMTAAGLSMVSNGVPQLRRDRNDSPPPRCRRGAQPTSRIGKIVRGGLRRAGLRARRRRAIRDALDELIEAGKRRRRRAAQRRRAGPARQHPQSARPLRRGCDGAARRHRRRRRRPAWPRSSI